MTAALSWVLPWVCHAALVTLVASAALRWSTHLSAATRYVVLWITLIVVIGLVPAAWIARTPAAVLEHLPAHPVVQPHHETLSPGRSDRPLELPRPPTWLVVIVACAWVVRTGRRLELIRRSLVHLRQLKRSTTPLPAGVIDRLPLWRAARRFGRPARLGVSTTQRVACVAGFHNPMIVIPNSFILGLRTDELDRVILHEHAHVQRRDDWAYLIQLVIDAVLGWHPAVWWIGRALRLEREVACDDWVVQRTGRSRDYASCLAKVAAVVSTSPRPLLAAPGMARSRGELSRRVERLIDCGRNVSRRPSRAGVCVSIVGLVTLALALAHATPALVVSPPQDGRADLIAAVPNPVGSPTLPAPPQTDGVSITSLLPRRLPASQPARPAIRVVRDDGPSPVSFVATLAETPQPRPLWQTVPLPSTPVPLPVVALPAPSPETGFAQRRAARSQGWGALADAGQTIGRTAASTGMAMAEGFSSVAAGFRRVFGAGR